MAYVWSPLKSLWCFYLCLHTHSPGSNLCAAVGAKTKQKQHQQKQKQKHKSCFMTKVTRKKLSQLKQSFCSCCRFFHECIILKKMVRRRAEQENLSLRGTEEWKKGLSFLAKADYSWLLCNSLALFSSQQFWRLVIQSSGQFPRTSIIIPKTFSKKADLLTSIETEVNIPLQV